MKRQFSAFSYKVVNQADDTLDIYVDGIIVDAETQTILKNWFGDETSVSYKSFRDQVTKADPKTINLFVNSDGGMVTDAMAIHDFMVDLEGKGVVINRKVRGIAASAATFLVTGKNSSMSSNSWLMIHNVSGVAWGNVDELERYAATARKINNNIVSFYAKKTGLKESEIQDMMNKETWMNAEEAKEKGFIDSIDGEADYSNAIQPEHWPYSNTAVLNAYNAGVKKPSDNKAQTEQNNFFTSLQNGFMKLIDSLTGAIKNGKEDPQFAKVENRDAILDMVNKVLSPVMNKIDEALGTAAVKNEDKPAEEKKETETKPAEEKKAEETTDDKKKEEEKKEEPKEEESELENLKKKLANQEEQLKKLRNDLAGKETLPGNPGGSKHSDKMAKVRVEYDN